MDGDNETDQPPARVRNIVELARIAGVSASTVSRALAGNPLIKANTRERIQALAEKHGFRLNQMASKLRTRETRAIGVVVPLGHERRQHISDPFFMTMLGHLADGLTESGYDLMLSRVLPDTPGWLDDIVDSGLLDGVLIIGQSDQLDAIEHVAQRYRPLVVWGQQTPGYQQCTIGSDNHAGGRLAARHLIANGRKRLAFLGDIRPPEIAARFAGANAAVQEAGLPALKALPVHLSGEQAQEDIATRIRRIGRTLDGIVCASDVIAMTALRALADEGLAVPQDIAVTGFDDLPIAAQTVPRLTSVRQDIARGAGLMIGALAARLRGEDSPSVQMTPELIVRDSA